MILPINTTPASGTTIVTINTTPTTGSTLYMYKLAWGQRVERLL